MTPRKSVARRFAREVARDCSMTACDVGPGAASSRIGHATSQTLCRHIISKLRSWRRRARSTSANCRCDAREEPLSFRPNFDSPIKPTVRFARSLAFEVWNGCPSFDISTPPGCDEWQGQYPEQWLMDGVFRRAREGNIVVRLTCAGTAGINGPSSTRRVQTLRRLALPSPIYRCSVGSAEKRRLDF